MTQHINSIKVVKVDINSLEYDYILSPSLKVARKKIERKQDLFYDWERVLEKQGIYVETD